MNEPRPQWHPQLGPPFAVDYKGEFPASSTFDCCGLCCCSRSGAPNGGGFDTIVGPPVAPGRFPAQFSKPATGRPSPTVAHSAPTMTSARVAFAPATEASFSPNSGSAQPASPQADVALLSFAASLGISPDAEPHLLPYAFQCMTAPPPPPWRAMRDAQSGRVYFANDATRASAWEHPNIAAFRAGVAQVRAQKQPQQAAVAASPDRSPSASTNPLSGSAAPRATVIPHVVADTP
jgi:hypothetical protein